MRRRTGTRWWVGLGVAASGLAWPQAAWAHNPEGLVAVILTVLGVIALVGALGVLHLALSVYLLARSARVRGSRWVWAHGVGAVLVMGPLGVASWGLLVSMWGEDVVDVALLGGAPTVTSMAAWVMSGLVWRRVWREGRVTPAT